MFKKAGHLFLTYTQSLYEYRGDLLIYTLNAFILPLILMSVWTAIADSKTSTLVNKQYVVQYYFIQMFVNVMVSAWHGPFFGEDIRDGKILKELIRPLGRIWYDITENIGEKVWKLILALPAYILVGYVVRDSLSPQILIRIPMLMPIVFLAAAIYFLMHHIIGVTAFWFSDTGAIKSFHDMIFFVTSGKLFPLHYAAGILPVALFNYLPYKYVIGFPLEVALGTMSAPAIMTGIAIQCFWLGVLYVLYINLWKKGLKIYGGYGG
ncbi:ABC-2 family transporter protein [Candidatus Gottesmanbacteria bacterium]|nr:ABC-2 family transporter protein [Candidatus Gottesmanbacteria bacterium]